MVTKPNGHSACSADRLSSAEIICWSRMQAESGQDLASIVRRKETERRVGEGVFLWGVGNPPGRLPAGLALAGTELEVVFSVMKTRPKAIDTAPATVLAWRRYVGADGSERSLPAHCLVTSRGTMGGASKTRHYALICRSVAPLCLGDLGPFDPEAYRNVSGNGAPIGASQVTALLRSVGPRCAGAGTYRVNLRATLTQDLWVRLCDPVVLCGQRLAAIRDEGAQPSAGEWQEFVAWIRESPLRAPLHQAYQPALL